jgi:ABC-type multidrug transport system fused ATPase/permease subunit
MFFKPNQDDKSFVSIVKVTLSLLSKKNRIKYWVYTVAQMATGLFDLLGAAFLTMSVIILGAAFSSDFTQSSWIAEVQNLAMFENLSLISTAVSISLLATILFIVKSVTCLFLIRKNLYFLGDRHVDVVSSILNKFFGKNLLFVEKKSSQEVSQSAIKGSGYLIVEILGPLAIALSEFTLLVLFTILLLFINPVLLMFTILLFGSVGIFLQRILGQHAARIGAAEDKASELGMVEIQEGIFSFRSVATFSREEYFIDNAVSQVRKGSTAYSERRFLEQIPKFAFEVALVIGILGLGLSQLSSSSVISASTTMIVFLTITVRSLPSMLRLQNSLFSIKHATGQAKNFLGFMDSLESEPARNTNVSRLRGERASEFCSNVIFENVSFAYPGQDLNAVSNLSFTIDQGDMVAIVGRSGAGKSTIMDLILGLLVPTEGTVQVGNKSADQSVALWRGQIAYVPQQTVLLSKSIRQNVAFGLNNKEIDDHLVWDLLEKVQLLDYVKTLPNKLDTLVGPGGIVLSGGERQRIGLIRALYSKPRLLLLDEATSALDSETEFFVSETLGSLPGETTKVIVAHRLSTVSQANKVLYIEKGFCQSFGTLDEVKKNSPNFDRQAKLFGLN